MGLLTCSLLHSPTLRGPGLPHSWRFCIPQNDTPQSVELLWATLIIDIHAPGGIRTCNPSKRAVTDPLLTFLRAAVGDVLVLMDVFVRRCQLCPRGWSCGVAIRCAFPTSGCITLCCWLKCQCGKEQRHVVVALLNTTRVKQGLERSATGIGHILSYEDIFDLLFYVFPLNFITW